MNPVAQCNFMQWAAKRASAALHSLRKKAITHKSNLEEFLRAATVAGLSQQQLNKLKGNSRKCISSCIFQADRSLWTSLTKEQVISPIETEQKFSCSPELVLRI
jgi:hypothetical protein